MVTGRGRRSTSLPFRARSYSFWPLTFRAEYMGGTCWMPPRKRVRTASSSGPATETGWVSSTVPVTSCVSVVRPSRRVARYSFRPPAANSTARVARPRNTGSTPVAMGSRVPAWPTRRS